MIRERPDVAAKRDECRMALRALKDAVSALESLPADLISRINGVPLCHDASLTTAHLEPGAQAASQPPLPDLCDALLMACQCCASQLLELPSQRRRCRQGGRPAATAPSLWCVASLNDCRVPVKACQTRRLQPLVALLLS